MKSTKRDNIVIALDAMGGDSAPKSVIEGAELMLEAMQKKPNGINVFFKIYGDQAKIVPLINASVLLPLHSELIHTSESVSPDEKPSSAIRNCKQSSMQLAINSVKAGDSDAILSAGNTGALMAMSIITLRTLPQINRPAIVAIMPSIKGNIAVLDLGANVEGDATNLYQFAIMGQAFAKIILKKTAPTIGLLNIGSEELKGKDSIKLASAMLKESPIADSFIGYIEGNDIAQGTADVIVTDGFTGNVVLKTIGGYGKLYQHILKKTISESFINKIKFLFIKGMLRQLFKSVDNRYYNGAMLVGINGIVVKSHGSMDDIGMYHAINTAYELSLAKINEHITNELNIIQSETTDAYDN